MIDEKIKRQVLELPDKERAELIHLLIDSLHPERKSDLEENWSKELKKRIIRYEQGECSTNAWENMICTARPLLDNC